MRLRSFLTDRRSAPPRPVPSRDLGDGGVDASELIARAEGLEAEGHLLDAVDVFAQANRLGRDTSVERRLVRLRHQAYGELTGAPGPSSWPVVPPGDQLVETGLPVIAPQQFTVETLSTGILRHGGLHVRRMVPEDEVACLRDGIDHAMSGFEDHASGASVQETSPWYEPFKPEPEYMTFFKRKRKSVREGVGRYRRDQRPSGVWTADSPRVLADLIETFNRVGLGTAIGAYFGERPVLSVPKCTLRRVPLNTTGGWHQDGAFLGEGIRSVNVWLSLSDCGQDAPGLDIVPARLDHVVETGTEGAHFPWSVSQDVVDRVAAATPVVRPIFEPGDVLLFDDLFLHRTAVDPAMTRERYAIETWLFAPSVYPDRQIPLVF
jgi:hypothetical protein